MRDEGRDKWKWWVLGILASVVAGLLLALLKPLVAPETSPQETQHSSSPSLGSPPTREVEVRILNLPRVTVASINELKVIQLRVFNGGNLAAESCQVQLSDAAGNRLGDSGFFGLTPGATENVDLTVDQFDRTLFVKAIAVNAIVECRNGHSAVYTTTLRILW